MDESIIESYLSGLRSQFQFNYVIHNDPNNSLLRIVLTNLVLINQTFDLNHLPLTRQGPHELFIHVDALVMNNSEILLPQDIHQLSINQATINESYIKIENRELSHRNDSSDNHRNISVIIGVEYTQIDSLSTFDQIPNDLILQITDCELKQVHKSGRLPENLVMLTFRDSSVEILGAIRTNSKLQLFSLEISDTSDNEFSMEIHSTHLLKARISTPPSREIVGNVKFFVPTFQLYFLDLQYFTLYIPYSAEEDFLLLVKQLNYLRLPTSTEISDKMVALMKLNGIDLYRILSK